MNVFVVVDGAWNRQSAGVFRYVCIPATCSLEAARKVLATCAVPEGVAVWARQRAGWIRWQYRTADGEPEQVQCRQEAPPVAVFAAYRGGRAHRAVPVSTSIDAEWQPVEPDMEA